MNQKTLVVLVLWIGSLASVGLWAQTIQTVEVIRGEVRRNGQEAAKPIDYETYCKLPDPESKLAAFRAMTEENRGTLVRTHLERWRDANQARLDEKQKAALVALIKVTTDTYADSPEGREARARSLLVTGTEVQRLFAKDDLVAMQPSSPCVAKK